MTDDNKKYITVSFVGVGLLVGLTIHLLLELLAGYFAPLARIGSDPVLSNVIPVAIGGLLFTFLQFNSHTVTFMDNVVSELRKVVWPSRRDTGLMTVVVCVMLIISGVVVGLYDSVSAYVVNYFLK